MLCSSGSSDDLLAVVVVSNPAMVFNWISGLILAFTIIINCSGFRVLDSLPSRPQAVANWLCVVSKVSNSSAITLWSASVHVSTLCAERSTSDVSQLHCRYRVHQGCLHITHCSFQEICCIILFDLFLYQGHHLVQAICVGLLASTGLMTDDRGGHHLPHPQL